MDREKWLPCPKRVRKQTKWHNNNHPGTHKRFKINLSILQSKSHGKLSLQERFSDSENNPSEALWHVPITWSTENHPNFDEVKPRFILSDRRVNFQKVVDENEWIIFNNKQSGNFRIMYRF